MMNDTFYVKQKQNNSIDPRLQQENVFFDSFAHGFELPASMQLQRVNRKLNTWDKTQDLVNVQKAKVEFRNKQII
jgi:hypothetical protein